MRKITALLTVLFILVGTFAVYRMSRLSEKPQPVQSSEPEFIVHTVEVHPGTHNPRLSSIGIVEARAEADFYSPLESEVLELPLEEGDLIGKNQSILTLDTRETRFLLEAQHAALDEIKAQIEALARDRLTEQQRKKELESLALIAEEERDRTRMLNERGVVSKSALQQARTVLGQRELELLGQRQKIDAIELSTKRLDASRRATHSRIGQLRLTLERARMLAPFDGIVKSLPTNTGQRVQRGTLLAQIYDPSTLRLRTPVPSSQAAGSIGDIRGQLRNVNPEQMLKLIGMAPVARKGTGSIDALFELSGDGWLLGGAVEIDLVLPSLEGTVALPFDALFSDARVYRVDADSRAELVECISLGQTKQNDNVLALLRCPNLAAGDQVVATRIPNLVSGSKLRTMNVERAGNDAS